MQNGFEHIIGKSGALLHLLEMVKKVAPTGATVLITGESGTGKELIARSIHSLSERREKLLLPVNCGALLTHMSVVTSLRCSIAVGRLVRS